MGSRRDGPVERPVAVSEHLLERMLAAGVTKLCFVIAPGKSDILEYYGGSYNGAEICYVVQEDALGLCDALFRPLPFIASDEMVCVGLPDTIWFPRSGFSALDDGGLSFLLFPVDAPERFDAVEFDAAGSVTHIAVKSSAAKSHWIWGGFKLSGRVLRELHALWRQPGRGDEYLGTLVNAYLAQGGAARAVPIGTSYVDVGTLAGYRAALRLLEASDGAGPRDSGDERGRSARQIAAPDAAE